MKLLIILLFCLMSIYGHGQDFEFRGKSRTTEIKKYNLGEKEPFAAEEEKEKLRVAFNGRELTIGKQVYKYVWHQNSKNMDMIQLNCIERDEEGVFPYKDATFEVVFVDNDHVEITHIAALTPTTQKRVKYFVDIERTTNQ